MAITVTEFKSGRNASNEMKDNQRKYTRVFQAVTDDPSIGSKAVLAATGIPAIGVPYVTSLESDAGSVAVRRNAVQDEEHPTSWKVTVEYETTHNDIPATDHAEPGTNPESRPPQYSLTFTRTTRAIEKDKDDEPIVNSADCPYLPPYEMEVSVPQITISNVYKTSFSLTAILTLIDAINDATYLGFSAKVLRCESIEAESEVIEAATYWKLKYVLAVNWSGWNPVKILSRGYYQLSDSMMDPGGKKPILDRWGNPISEPALLDSFGHVTDTPYFTEHNIYREVSFSGIP